MNTKRPSIQNNSLKKKHIEIRSSRSRISSSKNMNIKSIITRSNKKKSFKERKMIFLQKTQKQAEARLFNLIFESSPKVGSWIPTIFQILLTFFQTSFIHSNHLTKLYFQTLPDPLQLKKSFLNPNSIFNILSDSFNILTHTRKMGTYSIYFNLILLLTLLNLIYFILKKFSKISKFINFDLDNLKDSFLIKILSIILTNYNFFFFLGNILAVNSSFCREVTFKVTTGFQSGSNYLDSSYSSEYLEIAQTNLSTTFYKKKVSFLNDNAECGSFQYYSIAGLSWTLVVTNILLKHYSMKLMTFLPNFESSCTKLCNVDIFVDLIFLLILILKTLFISYLSHDIGKFQILNWINLALLLVCYTILTRNSIYYDLYFSRLKSFQIVYLVCLTAFGIFARETRLGSNMNESSTIVLFFVIMSLLLKFDHNLRKKIQLNEDENFEKRIFEVNQSSVEAQSLLYLYYQIISYISFWVRREKNLAQAVPGKITRTQFILGNLLNVHKQSCRKLVCFCKNSKHFQKISNIGFLKECTQKDLPLVFESLYIMQETFELFFKKNSLKENQIFNCYVYFLLNYFGSPKKAFKIMQKAINEKKSRGKSKSVREIQVYALFEQYNLVARKNIRNGILGLVKLINEFPDFEKKDKNEFSDMCEYFNFVQKFEELKLRVRRCFEFKLEFLDFLSRKKRVEIGKIMKISTKFCKEKIKVEERFEELDKITRMRYSPLYLTYGFYLNNITQEVSKGQRIMKKFQKISNLKNFIQAFNTSHKLKKVKMVIMLAEIGNQPGTQILKYSTTNCFELLGWKQEEILDEPIELIIPNPVKKFHKNFFCFSNENYMELGALRKKSTRFPALMKNNFLTPINLTLRLANTVDNSFQVSSFLQYKKSLKDCCLLLLDYDGRIQNLTENASRCFEKGKNLIYYNGSVFEKINRSLNIVFNDLLEGRDISSNDYRDFVNDSERADSWLVFFKAKELTKYMIMGDNGKVLTVEGRFEGFTVHKLKIFIKYFVIKRIENEVFNFERMVPKFECEDFDTIKNLISFDSKEGWHKKLHAEVQLFNDIVGRRGRYKTLFGFIKAKEGVSEEKENSDEEKNQEFNLQLNGVGEMVDCEVESPGREVKFQSPRSRKPKTTVPIYKKKQKNLKTDRPKKFENIVGSSDEDKMNSIKITPKLTINSQLKKKQKNSEKISKMIKIFKKNINKKIKAKISYTFLIIFFSIIALNSFYFFQISTKRRTASTTIKKQALIVDIYSWVFWGRLYTALSIDVLRSLKQGWLEEPAGQFLVLSKTYSSKWQTKLKRTGKLFLSPDNDIDTRVRDESLLNSDYQLKWINSEIEITVSNSSSKFEPLNIMLPRRAAIQFIQGFSDLIYYRDYENDTEIPMLKSNEERGLDPNEEVFRVNLVGDSIWIFFELSHEFFDFIYSVAEGQENDLLLDSVFLFGFSMIFVIALISVYLVELGKIDEEKMKFEMKEETLNEILLEESIVDNKLELSGKKKSSRLKSKKKKREKKFEPKIKLSFKKFNFSLIKITIVTLVISIIFQIMFSLIQAYQIPTAKLVKNLLKVYILGSDLWSSLAITHTYFIQGIIFNNTVPCWNDKKSLECYSEVKEYIDDILIDRTAELANLDLGNLTTIFSEALTQKNSCMTVFNDEQIYNGKCYLFYDGLFTSNLINSLRGMMTTMERVLEEWQQKRHDFELVKEILKSSRIDLLLSMFDEINASIYYFFTLKTSNMLIEKVSSPAIILENLVRASICFVVLIGSLFLIYTWSCLENIFFSFHSVFYVMPKKLIETNSVFYHQMDRVKKNKLSSNDF